MNGAGSWNDPWGWFQLGRMPTGGFVNSALKNLNVAAFTVYLMLMNVNDLFTLIHSHLFQLDII